MTNNETDRLHVIERMIVDPTSYKEERIHPALKVILCVFGIGLAFCMGFLLTMTVIGALVGVPLMILSPFSPLLVWQVTNLTGDCPHCGSKIERLKWPATPIDSVKCSTCKKRSILKDGEFRPIA